MVQLSDADADLPACEGPGDESRQEGNAVPLDYSM